jgi:hypothetical protein
MLVKRARNGVCGVVETLPGGARQLASTANADGDNQGDHDGIFNGSCPVLVGPEALPNPKDLGAEHYGFIGK